MKAEEFEVKAGLGFDLNKFGVISKDGEKGLGIEIMPHQWIGITVWDKDKETSICLEWDCGVRFLDALGYHSRYIEKMSSIVAGLKAEGEK